MKRALLFVLASLVVTQACALKDPGDYGDVCNNKNISYILEKDKPKCEPGQGCHEGAFEVGRCPTGFLCGYDANGLGYCYNTCAENQIKCGDSESECLDTVGGVVITDNTYCGAKGLCSDEGVPSSKNYRGVICGKNSLCRGGECVCRYEDDPHYCGAKGLCDSKTIGSDNFIGYDCGDKSTCIEGVCGCEEGYTQCEDLHGDSIKPYICIQTDSFMDDENHCGGCNQKCDGECIEGVCKRNCEGNVCGLNNECRNANDRCGDACVNCSQVTGEDAVNVCDIQSGECRKCKAGNEYDSAYQKCVSPEVQNCGGVDCREKIQHWATDSLNCDEDKCIVTACVPDADGHYYHPSESGDACVMDSDRECGAERINCLQLNEDKSGFELDALAAEMKCEEGQCKSISCKNTNDVDIFYRITNEYGVVFERFPLTPTECRQEIRLPADCCKSDSEFINNFCDGSNSDACKLCKTKYTEAGFVLKRLGYYKNRHIYDVNPVTNKCEEANQKSFCGAAHDNCGDMTCLSYSEDICASCSDVDSARKNKCGRLYKCGCETGSHRAKIDSVYVCVNDDLNACGADLKNCETWCNNEVVNCASAKCKNGMCLVESCKNGKYVCQSMNICQAKTELLSECQGESTVSPCNGIER